jgi:membrane-associated protease RseP (regulator of RpoE activity)
MKTNVIVTLLVLLTSILYFGPLNPKYNAGSQEQTGTKAPGTAVEQHKKAPAVSVIHVSFRPLNLALIPGGITSVEEFRQRVAEDPTLNSFFGSCDVGASFQPLPDDILAFIAFRRGQEIKWTRRPLLVHKGEFVLTFCGKTVLARCGNLISWTPMQPSEDVPPSLLETPVEERPNPQASDQPAPSYRASQVAEAPLERVPLDRALGVVGSMDGGYGIKIVGVTRGSPAAKAGLLAGDTVLALNGIKVKSERALEAQFANREAGSKIIATIMHGGWIYDVTITKANVHAFDHSLGFLFPGHTVEANP